MIKTSWQIAGVGIALMAAAGCGGSSSGTTAGSAPAAAPTTSSAAASSDPAASGNAAVCTKLKHDVLSLKSLNSAHTVAAIASKLDSVASEIKTDAASGSSALRSGVAKVSSVFDEAAKAVKTQKKPNEAKLESQLQSAEGPLTSACPS